MDHIVGVCPELHLRRQTRRAGGVGGTPNLASKLVERQRRYKSILIPVGLVKVLTNLRVFYPNREDFDLSRAVEFAYSPVHQVFGRSEDINGRTFLRGHHQGPTHPDLNAYRGFEIDPSINCRGTDLGELGQNLHGAGRRPELSGDLRRRGSVSRGAADGEFEAGLWVPEQPGDAYLPAASSSIGGGETDQLAVAITGGYRARFPYFAQEGDAASRNGMYVAADFHYL